MTTDPRNETLREKIATIVQTGHTEKWTADDVAGKIEELISAEQEAALMHFVKGPGL